MTNYIRCHYLDDAAAMIQSPIITCRRGTLGGTTVYWAALKSGNEHRELCAPGASPAEALEHLSALCSTWIDAVIDVRADAAAAAAGDQPQHPIPAGTFANEGPSDD